MGILKACDGAFLGDAHSRCEAVSLHQPPVLTPRAAFKHNLAIFTQLGQAATKSRVAVPGALDDLLPANPAGLFEFGE